MRFEDVEGWHLGCFKSVSYDDRLSKGYGRICCGSADVWSTPQFL